MADRHSSEFNETFYILKKVLIERGEEKKASKQFLVFTLCGLRNKSSLTDAVGIRGDF